MFWTSQTLRVSHALIARVDVSVLVWFGGHEGSAPKKPRKLRRGVVAVQALWGV